MRKRAFYLQLILCVLVATLSWAEEGRLSRPRIGLVLGGGSARGLAHIGVLKVLEEAQIPIDCVVGTSMGSLVGGAFAAGHTSEEIEQLARETNWVDALSGGISRDKLSYRRKQNDRLGLAQFEVGIDDYGGFVLPKSVVSTQKIALLLRRATLGIVPKTFDDLPIPYRAVAANIENGNMVVLDRGDLVTAMSASMALPGVFAPVEVNNQLLVDGGVARNLPVDVARNLCADVVIAVNVGEPPLLRDKMSSVLSMVDQLTRLLIAKNVTASLASLHGNDLLIEPDLDGLSYTEFNRSKEFIDRGELAARELLPTLKRYAVSKGEYQAWQAERRSYRSTTYTIAEVKVAVNEESKVNPEVLKEQIKVKPGDKVDIETLGDNLEKIYAASDLEQIGYELLYSDQGTVLNVLPVEKSWGPNYLSLGVGLRADLNGDSNFNLSALYRRTWINQLGAEWKVLAQVGETRRLYTEFYQPLMENAWVYIAPYLSAYSKQLNAYLTPGILSKFYANRMRVGVDVGSSVSRFGEIRIGLNASRYNSSTDGLEGYKGQSQTENDYGIQANLYYDQFDKRYFPSSGSYFHLAGYQSLKGVRQSIQYTRLALSAATAKRIGKLHSIWSIDAAYVSEHAPLSEYATLGGLFNLSGYQYKQLLGRGKALAKVQFYYPVGLLSNLSDRANYLGISLEAGRIVGMFSPYSEQHGKYAFTIYWATDTPLGPFYVAYARGNNAESRVYLILGANF